jgi:penicillin-binding protein 1A
LLDGHGGRFALAGSASPGHQLSFQASINGLSLRALPPELFTRGSLSLDDGSFFGEVSGTLSGKKLAARGTISLVQTKLRWPRLADDAVGPLDLSAHGEVAVDLGRRTLALHQVRLSANKAEVLVDASVADDRAFEVEVRLVQLDMRSAIETFPVALRPPPQAPRVEGALSGDLEVRGVLGKWDDLQIQRAELDLGGLKEAAQHQEVPSFLQRPFEFTPGNQEPPERTFEVGPGNPHFTPTATLPPYVVRAVVLSEDAGFYGHHGFDFDEIRESLSRDLAKGGAIRGGSTLTQQLVKNLFLSREKKLTRKIQEALVTLEVEATLSKSRILELYLNTIEWGPRLYGIGEAADRYFGEKPQELTPKQAAFLASIIPNPKKYYWYYSRGALTPNWEDRVGHILDKMEEVGVIDATQRAAAEAPLEFRRIGGAPPQEAEPSAGESSDESDGEKPVEGR